MVGFVGEGVYILLPERFIQDLDILWLHESIEPVVFLYPGFSLVRTPQGGGFFGFVEFPEFAPVDVPGRDVLGPPHLKEFVGGREVVSEDFQTVLHLL